MKLISFLTAFLLQITISSAVPSLVSAAAPAAASKKPACLYKGQVILHPKNNATIHLDSDGMATFEVLYCSVQYFKEQSLSGDLWFTAPDGSSSGEILTYRQQPDGQDADPEGNSYRFNTTIYPLDGENQTGYYKLTFYETSTGYYNSYNYETTSIFINVK